MDFSMNTTALATFIAENSASFLEILEGIVSRNNIYTHPKQTERYRKGFRSGEGTALAVVFPQTLLQQWRVFKACALYDVVLIMQAANTGLTSGSTPDGNDYDRPVIIMNTLKLKAIHLLNNAEQIIAFPGSTLSALETILKPYHRDPHSVIGSSCIGASIIGGICNNSGGALVHRGPAYTEMALFGRINSSGQPELINHLGLDLGHTEEEILNRLETHQYSEADIILSDAHASGFDYSQRVKEIDASTPARFNANKHNLFEASGSAGKVVVFAVRLDTFPKPHKTQVFYIGTNKTAVLEKLRRHLLTQLSDLPIAGEYIHRDAFSIAEKYGKDTFYLIQKLGAERMPALFALKGRLDTIFNGIPLLPKYLVDRALQAISRFLPSHLPPRMKEYHSRYEHHLLLKMADDTIDDTKNFLNDFFAQNEGSFFLCTPLEGERAFLHRFVVAGAGIRYTAVHKGKAAGILPLDIALRRNDQNWFEHLPSNIENKLEHRIYYGHFMCHVLHQEYIVKKGYDPHKIKEDMLSLLDERGAEYPAEHNVGHLYKAKPDLVQFYQKLDPTNSLNPGIGKTSKWKDWASNCPCGQLPTSQAIE